MRLQSTALCRLAAMLPDADLAQHDASRGARGIMLQSGLPAATLGKELSLRRGDVRATKRE